MCSLLTQKRSRRHLTAGHSVDCVVYEYYRDVFAAGADVNRFGGADSDEVAVTLVGENDAVGKHPLHAGSDCRSAAVRRLDHVAVKIVIRKYRAADRGDSDGFSFDAEVIDRLSYETVDYTVGAAGAVMRRHIAERLRSFKYNLAHYLI